ncbi:MAG: chitobiase/beta-hexosaminidase C-terminal domain-containing protein, partial [Alkalispirochaeta sp.]
MNARKIPSNRLRWHLVLLAAAAAIAMTGCVQPYDAEPGSGETGATPTDGPTSGTSGSMVITAIPPAEVSPIEKIGAAGITSSGFTVVTVELTASRDGYDDVVSTLAFDSDSGAWSGTAEELIDGEWLFTVRALDDSATPVILFSGSNTFTVESGSTNELTIEMKEEIGMARVDATWSLAGAIDTLEVIARRDNFADVASSVSVPRGADSASVYSLDLAVGDWTVDVVGYTDGVETYRSDDNAVSISNGVVTTAAISVPQTRVTPLTATADPAVQYATSFDVTIDTATPSTTITYTTDGTDPSSSGTASTGAAPAVVPITSTTTVRAIGSASGLVDSPEITLEYDLSGGAMVEVASWDADMSALIKDDGGLWVWGYNGNGELGLGDTDHRVAPVRLGSETWIDVGVGDFHMAAVKSDGTLWTWGLNGSGRLGDGSNTDSTTPVQEAQKFTDWTAVAVGKVHNLALRSDGTLWAWGWNNYGQLGTGNNTDRTIPTQVGTDTDWMDVATGYHFSFARKSDGTLYAWGRNHESQLGLGDTTDRTSPVQVGSASDWVFITAGYEMAGGIRNE